MVDMVHIRTFCSYTHNSTYVTPDINMSRKGPELYTGPVQFLKVTMSLS